jgi:O-antigen ligase
MAAKKSDERLKLHRSPVDGSFVNPQTATLTREQVAPALISSSSPKSQATDLLLNRLAAASVACTPFWLPIVNDWHAWSNGLVVTLGEVPLLGFTCLAIPKTIRTLKATVARRSPERMRDFEEQTETKHHDDQPVKRTVDAYVGSLFLLLVALALSTVAHPHARGVQILFRAIGLVCLADHVLRRRISAISIAYAFVGITAFEAALAMCQRVAHGPVGLSILGESPVPFYAIGKDAFSVCGTFPHPYPLAALGLLGGAVALVFGGRGLISSRVSLLGAFSGALLVGLTVSRAGLLSALGIIFGLLVSLALRLRQRQRPTVHSVSGLAIFVLGLAVGIGTSYGAWTVRATSQKVGTLNEMTSSRMDLVDESIDLYKLHPLLGVGPGRYSIELARHPELIRFLSPGDVLPVHNAPLLFLTEGGIPSALALLALALVIGRRLIQLGPDGIILLSAVFPFLMLDIVYTVLPSGLFLLGVWGVLVSYLRCADEPSAIGKRALIPRRVEPA